MGNSESTPPDGGVDDFDGIETLGYRVLGVQPNSPASAAGLVSFFDFLIGADGQMLLGSGEEIQEGEEYNDVDFPALLESFKGKTLQLLVWNIKCQETRLVDIVPNDDWEGAGLLGVTIRLDNYAGAEDRLIRILSVEHNSPAAIAGLVSSQDYLLGTTTHSFDSTKVLAAVLEAHVDRVVELYVYNTNSDKVRVVALMPTWSWGGNGLLGAEVGTGYLHRLPGSCRGTLGGSVERRVRWIGGSKNGPTSPQLQQAAALELEPQLEMEPNHEEEEEEEQSVGTVSLASQMSEMPEVAAKVDSEQKKQSEETQEVDSSPTPIYQAHPSNSNPDPTSKPEASDAPEKIKEQPSIPKDSSQQQPSEHEMTSQTDRATQQPPVTPTETLSAQQPAPVCSPASAPLPAAPGPAPAPYPLSTPPKMMQSDPAANPVNITMFIPAAKPPPDSKNVKAEDIFSGPPSIAQIPSKTNVVMTSPVHNPEFRKSPTQAAAYHSTNGGEGSPPFSTPHPPSAIRPSSDTTGSSPPPLVGQAVMSYGMGMGMGFDDALPPPPKMSGAR